MTTTREAALEAALKLARNRLQACAIDHPTGSREMYERSEWADEATAALSTPATEPQGDYAAALSYASSLAETLHDKHYSRNVSWKPMPDLLGLLTQIDNMVAGIIGNATPAPSDKIAEAARECRPETSGWWIIPAVIGGGVIWWWLLT